MALSRNILLTCLVLLGSVTTDAASLRAKVTVTASTAVEASRVSPSRRVINMLMMMQKKVETQSRKDDAMYDKFMCYCTTNKDKNKEQIALYSDRIPQLESSIQEMTAMQSQLESELTTHTQDRDAARKTEEESTSMRNKDADTYAAESTDQKANIAAMGKAIQALKAGMGKDEFLQTSVASRLQGLLVTAPPAHQYDREALSAFLQQGAETQDTSEILGILGQMKEEFEKDLKDMVATEEEAVASFEALQAAKGKEVGAATRAIEDKMGRLGDVKVQLVEFKHDLQDTDSSMGMSEQLLIRLAKECKDREDDYALIKRDRAAENVALSDTIKVLNNEDAQDLFSKTLPPTSLLQVSSRSRAHQPDVVSSFQQLALQHADQPILGLLAMRAAAAARQPKEKEVKPFMKVVNLIDEMVEVLGNEQSEDDQKRDMCRTEIPKNQNKQEQLETAINAKNADIDNTKDQLSTLKTEMDALKARVGELDKAVGEATAQRKEENSNFVEVLASNNAALQLLEIAKNQMNKFYNKKLHKEEAARQLTEGQRITQNMGGDIEAPSFLQTRDESADDFGFSSQLQEGSQSSASAQSSQSTTAPVAGEEAGGVLQMLDMIRADIQEEITKDQVTEKHSQDDYEGMIEASKSRRQSIATEITEKQGNYANLEESNQALEDRESEHTDEKASTVNVIANLHKECDFLLKSYDERKTARANEAETLQKGKAVLAGADFPSGRALEKVGQA